MCAESVDRHIGINRNLLLGVLCEPLPRDLAICDWRPIRGRLIWQAMLGSLLATSAAHRESILLHLVWSSRSGKLTHLPTMQRERDVEIMEALLGHHHHHRRTHDSIWQHVLRRLRKTSAR